MSLIPISKYAYTRARISKLETSAMIKQELYVFLLQKEEENALTMSMEMPKAQVVDEAYSLSKPVNLGLFKLMAIGFILGICIAAGVVSWKYGKKKTLVNNSISGVILLVITALLTFYASLYLSIN